MSLPGFSHHDLIYLTYNLSLDGNHEEFFSFYQFNRVNKEDLLSDAYELDWNLFYSISSVNEQLELLEHYLSLLMSRHVPLVSRRCHDSRCPWLNEMIFKLMHKRDKAYNRWKRFRTIDTREIYCSLRNKTTSAIRISKKRYFSSLLNPEKPTKELWSNLKNIGVCKSSSNSVKADPSVLNRNFLNSASGSDYTDTPPVLSSEESCSVPNEEGFSFSNVSQIDVITAISSVKSNSVGLDNIHPFLIKAILPVILPVITHVFNTAIMTSIFPSKWKLTKIIPIPKKCINNELQEYRPISILSFLSKVFEKILSQQILHHINRNNLLNSFQSGFRQKHSCTTALLKVSDDIRRAIDADMLTTLVLLDFSKAFDNVDHDILIQKLVSQFAFSRPACKLISSYLGGRRQAVFCNGILSDFLNTVRGVPQGSILGPLLFSLFINDVSLVIKNSKFHLYADDLQLYISRPIGLIEDAVDRMNADISDISSWAKYNKLKLNASKSESIVIYRRSIDTTDFPQILMDGSAIYYQEQVRDLGIILNKTLSWSNHINSVSAKIYGSLRKLHLSSFLPTRIKILLVKSLILPLLSFGCEIFNKPDSLSMRKLTVAFNCAVRYAFNLRRFDHVSQYVKLILGCSLSSFIHYRTIILLNKIITDRKPGYLYDLIDFTMSSRSLTLRIPLFNYYITENQFFVQAARIWNSLPTEVRRAGGSNFKRLSFDYFSRSL